MKFSIQLYLDLCCAIKKIFTLVLALLSGSETIVNNTLCIHRAIDIIFQVWEHAQKSKIFLPNKAYFLILLRIVVNFLNKNSLFHALFLHFKYYKN